MKDAGRRWIAEIVFSSIKRVLGEELPKNKLRYEKRTTRNSQAQETLIN